MICWEWSNIPYKRLADNLAPDPIWHRSQFGTKSVKESIWHRTQFGTGPIWHQECKRVNLAPDPIWHRSQFGTTQKEYILLLCTVETWKLFATNIILLFWEICLNLFSNPHFKSNPKTCTLPKFWQKRSSIEKVAHSTLCKCFPLFWARKGPQTQKQTVPSSNVGNKSPVLKRFPFTWARKGPQTQNKQYLP